MFRSWMDLPFNSCLVHKSRKRRSKICQGEIWLCLKRSSLLFCAADLERDLIIVWVSLSNWQLSEPIQATPVWALRLLSSRTGPLAWPLPLVQAHPLLPQKPGNPGLATWSPHIPHLCICSNCLLNHLNRFPKQRSN